MLTQLVFSQDSLPHALQSVQSTAVFSKFQRKYLYQNHNKHNVWTCSSDENTYSLVHYKLYQYAIRLDSYK